MINMRDVRILIIVPTLNSYLLLDNLIESLKNQSFKNWKLLFVDGNSDSNHIDFLIENSKKDKRISWVKQKREFKGIYGAMNQGLMNRNKNDWVLFWGSDDKAAGNNSLQLMYEAINKNYELSPYFIISKGRYFNNYNLRTTRDSFFFDNKISKIIKYNYYSFLFFIGNAPPHQGILHSPKALSLNKKIFNENFDIAADLKYFLDVSLIKKINIYCMDKITVLIGAGGFSSKHLKRKLDQVFKAYYLRFGLFFFMPFILRYFRKLITLF